MSRYTNKQLITEIQNGNEEVLVYLASKYFRASSRMLRLKGVKDSSTPGIFSTVLVKAWMDILHHKFPPSIEFETFFFNTLTEYIRELKVKKHTKRLHASDAFSVQQRDVVAQCVSILDENARNLVYACFADHLSYEGIAARFNYSNAVIAQHEVNKAMNQLEGIVKLRLNISNN